MFFHLQLKLEKEKVCKIPTLIHTYCIRLINHILKKKHSDIRQLWNIKCTVLHFEVNDPRFDFRNVS